MSANQNQSSPVSTRIPIQAMAGCALMAALLCILSPMSIPIGPVPVSLTVFVAFLSVYALGRKFGTLSYILYLLLGLFGLPVFSGYTGGPGKFAGPTGGFLVGMILMCWIAGFFIDRFSASYFTGKHFPPAAAKTASLAAQAAGMILGDAVNYVFGTIWFLLVYAQQISLLEVLKLCVFPFIAIDLIKIALALLVGNTLRSALRSANLKH